jgi:hypothetical protein
MSKSKKQTITEIIIKELPENYFDSSDIEKIIFKIWYTGRTGTGLRLTEEGKKAFADANITYYEYLLDISKLSDKKKKYNKLSLQLDKKIACPFYLGIKEIRKKQPYIVVYDSRVAMMINLYGSIAEFLELYKI